jgi:phage regulator Rha-like protein
MNELIKVGNIRNRIFELRGQKVILDKDIAELFGVEPRRMRESVRRNIKRFPSDFMFQLTNEEFDLVTQFASPLRSRYGGSKPYVFTRNGVNMLAAVLRSKTAIDRSIFIMRAFSALEEAIAKRKNDLLSSPDVINQLSAHSKAIYRLFKETDVNKKQMAVIKQLQESIGKLLQKIILESIKEDKD